MPQRHAKKSNGVTFRPLENKVAPMIVKLAESLERMGGQLSDASGGGGDGRGQAMMKIAKQIKKSREESFEEARGGAREPVGEAAGVEEPQQKR